MEKTEINQRTHYNRGKFNKIALVFSCPGKKEEEAKKPVAGCTGKYLDLFLKKFLEISDDLDKNFNRYNYRITNSYDKVLYKSKDGRTEPNIKEICEERNIKRLFDEIKDTDIVIAFGRKAQRALDEIMKKYQDNVNIKVIKTRHLSLQFLNRMKINGNGSITIEDKIDYLVMDAIKQLNEEEYSKIKKTHNTFRQQV